MNLLAVDTSTRSCSVAVMTGDRIASELTSVSSRTHTAHLMAMIREALALAHTEPAALDGFAVTVGPGSFTGLRIGISTVKGLAFACGKPSVGISSLEALAAACPPHPHAICSIMDARKGQVYTAVFRQKGAGVLRIGEERAVSPEDLLQREDPRALFVGDGAALYAELIRSRLGDGARIAAPELNYPKAATVARLARVALAEHPERSSVSLRPRYLRRSDADLGIRPPAARSSGPPA
jgi:tRNA threonylcarbamoyladenosine biosynthesis protein TsaB